MTPRQLKRMNQYIASGFALPASTEVTYIDYKEPLRVVAGGFGYYGTLATNKEHTHIQCHKCGNMFANLALHLRSHNIVARDYKLEYGLSLNAGLISDTVRLNKQVAYDYWNDDERKAHLMRLGKEAQANGIKGGRANKNGTSWSLERRNRRGNCPDQVIEKIQSLATELNHQPTYEEYEAKYGNGIMRSLKYHYGSWNKAVKIAGFNPRDPGHPAHDRIALLLRIKEFTEQHGREPQWADFNTPYFVSVMTYYNAFGSIPEARKQAAKLHLAYDTIKP